MKRIFIILLLIVSIGGIHRISAEKTSERISSSQRENIEALTYSEGIVNLPCIPATITCFVTASDAQGRYGTLRVPGMVHI